MARLKEKNLYKVLVENGFSFVGNGRIELKEIYSAVKANYGEFCDDNYICIENCKQGNNQPEWNHIVRKALYRLKKIGEPVNFSGNRRFWYINY